MYLQKKLHPTWVFLRKMPEKQSILFLLPNDTQTLPMGIKGLLKLINENRDQICSPAINLRGKILVDVMVYFMSSMTLESWSGPVVVAMLSSTEQQRRFISVLIQSGVGPIVILDGGGTKTSIEDIVHRRQRNINEITKELKKHHKNAEHTKHHFPLLSRQVYTSTLKQIHNLQMYVADRKARKTVVILANHYHCPILTNNTNYCVSGVA